MSFIKIPYSYNLLRSTWLSMICRIGVDQNSIQSIFSYFCRRFKKIKELQKLTLTRVKMGSRVSCFVMTSVKWNLCFFSENKLIYYHVDLCVKKLSHCGLSKSIFFDRDKNVIWNRKHTHFYLPNHLNKISVTRMYYITDWIQMVSKSQWR